MRWTKSQNFRKLIKKSQKLKSTCNLTNTGISGSERLNSERQRGRAKCGLRAAQNGASQNDHSRAMRQLDVANSLAAICLRDLKKRVGASRRSLDRRIRDRVRYFKKRFLRLAAAVAFIGFQKNLSK